MSSAMRALAFASLAAVLAVPVAGQTAGRKPAAPIRLSPSPTSPPAPAEAVIETAEGEIVIRLLPDMAPSHVAHLVKTARAGGYDGTTFHRIIPHGIIQGGDPLSKDPAKSALYGTGGLGLLKAEFSDRPFVRGAVGAARRSHKDSGGSQFFICLSDQTALNGQYTLLGEVVSGLDVADRIGGTPVDGDKPQVRVEMRKVSIRSPVGN